MELDLFEWPCLEREREGKRDDMSLILRDSPVAPLVARLFL